MRLLYFAHARSATGCAQEDLPLAAPLAAPELWDLLVQRHPKLAPLRAVSRLARGEDFLPAEAILAPTDEIALIPPVSGG